MKTGDFFSYDRSTGLVERVIEEDGVLHFYVEGDLKPFMDRNTEIRNTRVAEKGIFEKGKEMHLHAVLDPITIIKLRERGINIYSNDPAMQRAMFQALEGDFAYCKVTNRKHIPKVPGG